MPISPTSFLSEIVNGKSPIPKGKLAYFRERLRHDFFDFIVSAFLEKERKGELTRAQLADRIHRSREQITRWLSSPGNWELDTMSDLVIGIFCGELKPFVNRFVDAVPSNSNQDALLQATITSNRTTSGEYRAVRTKTSPAKRALHKNPKM